MHHFWPLTTFPLPLFLHILMPFGCGKNLPPSPSLPFSPVFHTPLLSLLEPKLSVLCCWESRHPASSLRVSYQVSPAPALKSPWWKDIKTLATTDDLSNKFLMLKICDWSDPFLSPKHILVSIGDKLSQRNILSCLTSVGRVLVKPSFYRF